MNKEIASQLHLHKYPTLEETVETTIQIERGHKKDKQFKPKRVSTSWGKGKEVGNSSSNWSKPKNVKQDFKKPFEKTPPPQRRNVSINVPREGGNKPLQCFKCQGWGHVMSECLNRKAFVMREEVLCPENEEEWGCS